MGQVRRVDARRFLRRKPIAAPTAAVAPALRICGIERAGERVSVRKKHQKSPRFGSRAEIHPSPQTAVCNAPHELPLPYLIAKPLGLLEVSEHAGAILPRQRADCCRKRAYELRLSGLPINWRGELDALCLKILFQYGWCGPPQESRQAESHGPYLLSVPLRAAAGSPSLTISSITNPRACVNVRVCSPIENRLPLLCRGSSGCTCGSADGALSRLWGCPATEGKNVEL